MTESQVKAIRELRDEGYAICIFTPDELGSADVDTVEEQMCERGWQAIECLQRINEEEV